jgi:AcrR family transcriptional regulator
MANVKNNASAKETKRRLIEAAGAVFAEHGFERATIKEITERAGASMAAVNYHFSDKQELYDQLVEYVHTIGRDAFQSVQESSGHGTPQVRLHQFVHRLLEHVLDPALPAWHCQIKAREMQKPGSATERLIEKEFRPFTKHLQDLMQELVGKPLSQVELTRLVNSVIAQCIFYAHNRELLIRLYPDQPPATEVVDELADHISKFTLAALSCW